MTDNHTKQLHQQRERLHKAASGVRSHHAKLAKAVELQRAAEAVANAAHDAAESQLPPTP